MDIIGMHRVPSNQELGTWHSSKNTAGTGFG